MDDKYLIPLRPLLPNRAQMLGWKRCLLILMMFCRNSFSGRHAIFYSNKILMMIPVGMMQMMMDLASVNLKGFCLVGTKLT